MHVKGAPEDMNVENSWTHTHDTNLVHLLQGTNAEGGLLNKVKLAKQKRAQYEVLCVSVDLILSALCIATICDRI